MEMMVRVHTTSLHGLLEDLDDVISGWPSADPLNCMCVRV